MRLFLFAEYFFYVFIFICVRISVPSSADKYTTHLDLENDEIK